MRDPGQASPVEQPHSNRVPTLGVPLKGRRVRKGRDSMGVPQESQGGKRRIIGYKWVMRDQGLGVPPKRVRVPVYAEAPKAHISSPPNAAKGRDSMGVPQGGSNPGKQLPRAPRSNTGHNVAKAVVKTAAKSNYKPVAQRPRNAGVQHLPKHNVPANSPKGHPHGGGSSPLGGGGMDGLMTSLYSMLGHSNTAHMLPTSLADQAASPDTALAATLLDQINRLPHAKKQALKNIGDWFGQVQTAEKHGAARDQAAANAGAASMQDAAQGIMASLGGSAMAGSGEVGAMGINDANTMKAIGVNDANLANELSPIFKLSAANAKSSRAQQYDNQLHDLQDQRGQALGQADAARAAALMQILQSNNASRQTNFGNTTGLLNTLAGLQISGMNAASQAQERQIMNALHLSEIQKNSQRQQGGLEAMTPAERASFADKITQGITAGKLSWPDALRAARNTARSAGLNPFGNQVIQAIIGPALANAGITGPNGGFWPAIYRH